MASGGWRLWSLLSQAPRPEVPPQPNRSVSKKLVGGGHACVSIAVIKLYLGTLKKKNQNSVLSQCLKHTFLCDKKLFGFVKRKAELLVLWISDNCLYKKAPEIDLFILIFFTLLSHAAHDCLLLSYPKETRLDFTPSTRGLILTSTKKYFLQ